MTSKRALLRLHLRGEFQTFFDFCGLAHRGCVLTMDLDPEGLILSDQTPLTRMFWAQIDAKWQKLTETPPVFFCDILRFEFQRLFWLNVLLRRPTLSSLGHVFAIESDHDAPSWLCADCGTQ